VRKVLGQEVFVAGTRILSRDKIRGSDSSDINISFMSTSAQSIGYMSLLTMPWAIWATFLDLSFSFREFWSLGAFVWS